MRANLVLRGDYFSIWTLDQEGTKGDEVKEFLSNISDSRNGAYAKGLWQRIEHIARNGLANLPEEIRDCWEVEGERFCELKKEPWRVSYFIFDGRRVLLATVFRKYGMKAKKEYRRAVKLFVEFRRDPHWEERRGL
jgi:hypothetical protein